MTAPLPQSAATALWVLHHCPDRRDAARWAAVAVERGATQQQADDEMADWDAENAPAVVHSTAVVSPRCGCGHVGFRHVAEHGRCQARLCRCVRFLAPTPAFSPDELATLHRIENTRPAPESWRGEEEDQ